MIEIVEDHFPSNVEHRQLQLEELDTPLGDRIARTKVHQYGVEHGCQPMTTLYNDDHL